MRRRAFLATGITGFVAAGLSGCLGRPGESDDAGGGSAAAGTDATDGYAPARIENPDRRSIDTRSFETVVQGGIEVPLAPIDATYYWYARREARFVDVRSDAEYEQSHVLGAVLSPAPDGGPSDPVEEWPEADRIVCYCGCPHHLSSMRAADLLSSGYENVFVIDEGFWEWHDRGYPMAGSETTSQPKLRTVRGWTRPAFAGRTAWVSHEPTDQREAARIEPDGSYHLDVRFVGVTADSPLSLRTPEYTITAPLSDLTGRIVTAKGRSLSRTRRRTDGE